MERQRYENRDRREGCVHGKGETEFDCLSGIPDLNN